MTPLSNDNTLMDAGAVILRLEECGRTLLALPAGGYSTKMRSFNLDVVRSAVEAYGWEGGKLRPAVPSAGHISRMDAALCWVQLIPQDRYVLRRRRTLTAYCLLLTADRLLLTASSRPSNYHRFPSRQSAARRVRPRFPFRASTSWQLYQLRSSDTRPATRRVLASTFSRPDLRA